MPGMRRTRGSAMGIPRVLPRRIFLPSSPAHAREQSNEKFQAWEIIGHSANDFNERVTAIVHVSTAVIDAKSRVLHQNIVICFLSRKLRRYSRRLAR
jgi:hypothetical protein